MKVYEIIEAFQKVKEENPEQYYNAMGYGDNGVSILNPFFGSSYDLGLIAGAMYALEHLSTPVIHPNSITFIKCP